MCDCEQNRTEYKTESGYAGEAYQEPGIVKVRLVTDKTFTINGDITGRRYIFKKTGDINWIDKRDFEMMKEVKELQATIF